MSNLMHIIAFIGVFLSGIVLGCEDGDSMAMEAAKDAAKRVASRCKVTQISDPKVNSEGEDVWVTLKCPSGQLIYRVTLNQVEDSACYVKKVKRVNQAPGPDDTVGIDDAKPVKCPRPGTVINCFPPTTNPYCRLTVRRWVQAHCAGVRYRD